MLPMRQDDAPELDPNLDDLGREDLVNLVKTLQKTLKRAQTFESTTSCSSNSPQSSALLGSVWIRAVLDDPYDRDRGNNINVLAYDQTLLNIDVRNRHEFEGIDILFFYPIC